MSEPLAGIKILDLSQVIAGPYGSGLLSYAGAETIKIEIMTGEHGRNLAGSYYGLNRGKRSLPLNLQSEGGRDILLRLARDADVFVENFRPGVVDRLGIDYETLRQINPRLIYVSVSAFGAGGPYAHRPGVDPLIQALTGIERWQGGENPPVFLRIAITDYTTGMMQAAAISMALFDRERTGQGAHINLSLLRAGVFINAEAFSRYEGKPPLRLPDKGQNGFSAGCRMYKAADGHWLFLLLEEDEERWRKLTALAPFAMLGDERRFGTPELRAENDAALADALETVFATGTRDAWVDALEAAGVPSAPVIPDYDRRLFEDVQPIINGYLVAGNDLVRGRVEHAGNYLRFSAAETQYDGRIAPQLGQHTEEILAEMGFSPADIERLRVEKVVL